MTEEEVYKAGEDWCKDNGEKISSKDGSFYFGKLLPAFLAGFELAMKVKEDEK